MRNTMGASGGPFRGYQFSFRRGKQTGGAGIYGENEREGRQSGVQGHFFRHAKRPGCNADGGVRRTDCGAIPFHYGQGSGSYHELLYHGFPAREAFLEVTRAQSYVFGDYRKAEGGEYTAGNRTISCTNHNAFLQMMDGALSGKTGYTGKAGYCYVGALERTGRHFPSPSWPADGRTIRHGSGTMPES